MTRILSYLIILVFFTCACGCESDDDSARSGAAPEADDDNEGDDDNDDGGGIWGECPDYVGGFFECATFEVPLDYGEPEGKTIPIFVYRHLAFSDNPKGQIWMLEGGPGGSGVSFAPYIHQLFAGTYPQWDFYSLDHRGVGNSARLGCPAEDDFTAFDYEACADSLKDQWGDDVKHFTTTNAALDLGFAIDETREEGKKVYVYGVSYGTYWLQRYLQVRPDQADAVVMDSLAMPTLCYLDNYDHLFNEIGKQIMDICEGDSVCDEKLGSIAESPWDAVAQVFDRIDRGDLCDSFAEIDRTTLRQMLGIMEMDWFSRVLIPPTIYRLNRCDESDVGALENLFYYLLGAYKQAMAEDWVDVYHLNSDVLGFEVILSEMWSGRDYDSAMAIVNEAFFSIDSVPSVSQIGDWGHWPTYEDDGYFEKWADTDIPILMMNGTLDPQTPLEIAGPAAERFTGAHQQFVTVPYSPHCVMASSWTTGALYGEDALCGEKIMFDFFDDPAGTLDLSCLDEIYPLEFDGASDVNMMISDAYLNTSDMWEGRPDKAKDSGADDGFKAVIMQSLIDSLRRRL